MNYKMMGRFMAQIVAIEAVFMIPALLISVGYGEQTSIMGFLYTLAVMAAVLIVLFAFCRKAGKLFGAKRVWSAWV